MVDTIVVARSGIAVHTRIIRNPLLHPARSLVMRGQLSACIALLAFSAIGESAA